VELPCTEVCKARSVSRRERSVRALLVCAVTALLVAPAAQADKQIIAAPPSRYLTTEVTMDQGERVTFINNDAIAHDVTARDEGPDGRPLFGSRLVAGGGSAPVEGAEYLTTGRYRFLCSIHPQMEGALNVSSAGTPVPRPGGGGGVGAPSLGLRVLDSKLSRVRRRGTLRVRVKTDEAATVRATARGSGTLAKGTAKLSGPGSKTLGLKLTRAGRRVVGRARRVRVTVSARATDAAGNTTKKTAKATLRR
jgi:plastocyanin